VSKIGGTVTLFIDGQQAVQTAYTAEMPGRVYGTTPFQIGKAQGQWAADGVVDQVRIYDRVLSRQEVSDLFNEGGSSGGGTGIPIGLTGFLPSQTTGPWTSAAITTKNLKNTVQELEAAAAQNPKMRLWFIFNSADESDFFTDTITKAFNYGKWKASFDSAAAPFNPNGTSQHYIDSTGDSVLAKYIVNGSLQGIWLLDDVSAFKPGPPPSFQNYEDMATHAKMRFPGITTAIRARPRQLAATATGHGPYTKLDAGWAQYKAQDENPRDWRDNEIAAADDLNLGVVFGINATGGSGSADDVPVDTVVAWGRDLLAPGPTPGGSDYVCAFIIYNKDYTQATNSKLATLRDLAASHAGTSCKQR
jgi:hypothetical protein